MLHFITRKVLFELHRIVLPCLREGQVAAVRVLASGRLAHQASVSPSLRRPPLDGLVR